MAQPAYYTEEGLQKLKEELHQLKTFERPKISQQIADARDKGDLSENAEYDAAKDAQGMLEARIARMENLLSNARLIDPSEVDDTRVYIHSKVMIRNVDTETNKEFILVAESEADIKVGKISVTSPIGKGLLGKEVDEIAEIEVPSGVMRFQVIQITRE